MLLAIMQVDNVQMSARNIEKLQVNFASAVRVYDVLRADKIVIEEEALAYIQVLASAPFSWHLWKTSTRNNLLMQQCHHMQLMRCCRQASRLQTDEFSLKRLQEFYA